MKVVKLDKNRNEEVIIYQNKVWYHENGVPLTQTEINSSPIFKQPPNQPKPFTEEDRERFIQKMRNAAKKSS